MLYTFSGADVHSVCEEMSFRCLASLRSQRVNEASNDWSLRVEKLLINGRHHCRLAALENAHIRTKMLQFERGTATNVRLRGRKQE